MKSRNRLLMPFSAFALISLAIFLITRIGSYSVESKQAQEFRQELRKQLHRSDSHALTTQDLQELDRQEIKFSAEQKAALQSIAIN